MATFEEILKTMKPEEAEVLQAWHDSDVKAEKDHGTAEYRKRSGEVNKFRDENKKLRDFLKGKLEYDPDGDLEAQFTEAEEELTRTAGAAAGDGKGKDGNGTSAEFEKYKKDMEKKFSTLQATLDKTQAEKDAADRRIKTNKITGILIENMKDIPSAPFVVKDFINSGKVDLDESGENVVFVEGDEKHEMTKALENFRKTNAHLVVINQAGGAGSSAGPRGAPAGQKQMHYDEWLKLPPIERAAFVTGGGKTYT